MTVGGQSRVLVVDDDDTVREVLRRYLTRDGHEVIEAADGITGLNLARTEQPDLLVLDLMLPGMDGLDVCRELRKTSDVPVIMLTALGPGIGPGGGPGVRGRRLRRQAVQPTRAGTAGGSRAGPQPRQHPARAGCRRWSASADGELSADPVSRTARCRGVELALTGREFDLLVFLLQHPGQVFGRAELMERVWGWSFGDQSTVTVHVRRLREKIEPDPARPTRIVTVWGVGYRLDPGHGDRRRSEADAVMTDVVHILPWAWPRHCSPAHWN